MWSEGWKQRWWLGLRSRKMAHLVPAGGEHPRLTPQGMGSLPLRGRGGGHSAHGPHTHTPGCHTPRSGTSWRAATRCTSYSRPRPGRCTSTSRFFSSPLSTPPMRPWSPSSTKTKNCTRYQGGGMALGRHGGAAGWLTPAHVAHAFPLQLVYLIDNQQGRLVKRLMPVEQLLMYQQISDGYVLERQG